MDIRLKDGNLLKHTTAFRNPNSPVLTILLQRKELLEIQIEVHDLSSYDNENTLFGESSKGVHSDIDLGEDKRIKAMPNEKLKESLKRLLLIKLISQY